MRTTEAERSGRHRLDEDHKRRERGPQTVRLPPSFEVGSYVYYRVERYTRHADDGQKFVPQWQGPYLIRSKVTDSAHRYLLARTETSATFEAHSARLKATAPRTYGAVALAHAAADGVGAGRGIHLMDSSEMLEIDRIVDMNSTRTKALVRFVGNERNERWIAAAVLREQHLGDLLSDYEEGHLRATRSATGAKRFALPAPMVARLEGKRTHDAFQRPYVLTEGGHDDQCFACGRDSGPGNALLMCDVCPRVFHYACLNLDARPRAQAGAFICPECQELENSERRLPPSLRAGRAPLRFVETEPPTPLPSAMADPAQARGPGRPKGSRNKPKAADLPPAPAAATAPAAAAMEVRPPNDGIRTRSRVERFGDCLYPGVNAITAGPTTLLRTYPRPTRVYWTRAPITSLKVDAIVNAANDSLLGGGGVDGAIHAAAGPRLRQACVLLGGCPTGQTKITPGFNLPAKHVIHAVGPHGGEPAAANLLRLCYLRALDMAVANGLGSLAFPCISAGAYGFEPAAAARIALEAVQKWLEHGGNGLQLDDIVFVLVSKEEEELYIQLWPTAFYHRLFDKQATAPCDEALGRLLRRPQPEPTRRAPPGRQQTESVRTVTMTDPVLTEEPERDRATSDPPGLTRTCHNGHCGAVYPGSRSAACPKCGRARD